MAKKQKSSNPTFGKVFEHTHWGVTSHVKEHQPGKSSHGMSVSTGVTVTPAINRFAEQAQEEVYGITPHFFRDLPLLTAFVIGKDNSDDDFDGTYLKVGKTAAIEIKSNRRNDPSKVFKKLDFRAKTRCVVVNIDMFVHSGLDVTVDLKDKPWEAPERPAAPAIPLNQMKPIADQKSAKNGGKKNKKADKSPTKKEKGKKQKKGSNKTVTPQAAAVARTAEVADRLTPERVS